MEVDVILVGSLIIFIRLNNCIKFGQYWVRGFNKFTFRSPTIITPKLVSMAYDIHFSKLNQYDTGADGGRYTT